MVFISAENETPQVSPVQVLPPGCSMNELASKRSSLKAKSPSSEQLSESDEGFVDSNSSVSSTRPPSEPLQGTSSDGSTTIVVNPEAASNVVSVNVVSDCDDEDEVTAL